MANQAKAVPAGFHTVTSTLIVDGAAKAIDFYKKAFGAQEVSRFEGPDGKIMHAEIRIGDSPIMLSDEMPQMGVRGPKAYQGPPAARLWLYLDNVDGAWKRAIDAGAKEIMALDDQFWGDRMGQLEDPFGHVWSVAQHVKDMTPEELKKAGDEFFAHMEPQKR
jgi:PhnB protein